MLIGIGFWAFLTAGVGFLVGAAVAAIHRNKREAIAFQCIGSVLLALSVGLALQ